MNAPTFALAITRTFDAPRALVFKAWTDPALLKRWSGPRGFTTPECAFEPRPGSVYTMTLRGLDGDDHRIRGVVREIDPPRRLVLTSAWLDAEGRPGPESIITVTFDEVDGRTRMTFRQEGFRSEFMRDSHDDGWSSSFDVLDEVLGPVPIHTVTTMRTIPGAAAAAFEAWTDRTRLGAWLDGMAGVSDGRLAVLEPKRRAVVSTGDGGFVEARFFATESGRTELTLTRAWRGAAPPDAERAAAGAALDRAIDRFAGRSDTAIG